MACGFAPNRDAVSGPVDQVGASLPGSTALLDPVGVSAQAASNFLINCKLSLVPCLGWSPKDLSGATHAITSPLPTPQETSEGLHLACSIFTFVLPVNMFCSEIKVRLSDHVILPDSRGHPSFLD